MTASNAQFLDRIRIVRGDITQQDDVDAIVSAISTTLDCEGSLNARLIERAGEALDEFILEHINKPHPGDVYAVPAFDLPVKHILFAVLPHWRSGFEREDRDLLRCYRGGIETAQKMKLSKIAFPALGAGRRNGFPVRRAARLAIQGIADRLLGELEEVRIVCQREDIYEVFVERLKKEKRRSRLRRA